MNSGRPCILVYNPLAGHGHLDSWNALFVSLLLAGGYRVIAVTEDCAALSRRLEASGDLQSPNLQLFDLADLRPGSCGRAVAKIGRILRRVCRTLSGSADPLATDPQAYYLEPAEFARHLQKVLKKSRWAPAMVLNMYMDLYRTDPARWQAFDRAQSLPWIGIRFIPRENATEAYYRSESLSGMCFLDQSVVDAYRARFPAKRFFFLPDVTHTDLPDERSALAQRIVQEAAGRKIVFLGGTIVKSKNIAAWFRLIALADPQQWYFVQIGEIRWDELDPQELQALRAAVESPRGNLLIHDGYLPDERTFNEIMMASDIIFAVYRDFPISSNMLGKAAAFEKPILVADNHLMGARVIRYGIGRAVPQDDPEAMLLALNQLVDPPQACTGFHAYREDFGREVLAARLDELIDHCCDATLRGGAA